MSQCTEPGLGDLLHAYELRLLSEEDGRRFEYHMLTCEHCFNAVEEFEQTTRLIRDEEVKEELTADYHSWSQEAPSLLTKLWRYLWPKSPEKYPDPGAVYSLGVPYSSYFFKPLFLYLVIIFLMIPAYFGAIYLVRGTGRIRPVQTISLLCTRTIADNTLVRGSGLDGAIRFEFPDAVSGRRYQAVISAEDSTEIVRIDNFSNFDQFGIGELIFPHRLMKPGRYRLIVTDTAAGVTPNRRVYQFMIIE